VSRIDPAGHRIADDRSLAAGANDKAAASGLLEREGKPATQIDGAASRIDPAGKILYRHPFRHG